MFLLNRGKIKSEKDNLTFFNPALDSASPSSLFDRWSLSAMISKFEPIFPRMQPSDAYTIQRKFKCKY